MLRQGVWPRGTGFVVLFTIVMVEAVRVEGLVKRFGSLTAVDGISFTVESGEIFGILGPNGAGKTTTLEIIEGLQKPTQGSINVLGLDVSKEPGQVKARIGVQLQSSAYHDYLSLKEILALLGSFYPKRVAPEDLLERVGLLDRANSRVKQLSGGQQQRFTVAASLVNSPELVILDEPTSGLDPQARRNLWGLIQDIQHQGVTVVMTTHYMEEAEYLCDRLAIMDGGRLLTVDSPSNLISQLKATYTVKLMVATPLSEAQIASLSSGVPVVPGGVSDVLTKVDDKSYLLRLPNTPGALGAVMDEIVRSGISLEHLEITPVTLEDVFLDLTGDELKD